MWVISSLNVVGKSHSKGWITEKTKRLKELLLGWKTQERSQSQSIALTSMVSLLLEFDKQLNYLEKQIWKNWLRSCLKWN